MGTTTVALATRDARPALRLLIAAVFALAAVATASAKDPLGPGPFDSAFVTSDGVTMRVASASNAVLPTGSVAVSAAGADGQWVALDRRPSVDGARMLLRGTVGGVPLDEFFARGDQRRLRVRDAGGRTTELDVLRFDDTLLITHANRRPAEQVESAAGVYARDVAALESGEITVSLPAKRAAGYDVALTATLPDLPPNALDQLTSFTARGADGGSYFASAYIVARVAVVHFTLPEGAYTLSASVSPRYADVYGGSASATARYDALATLDVSGDRRSFAVAIPPNPTPAVQVVDVVVDNLAELAPSFASRVDVGVRIVSADGLVTASTTRDVADADPLTVQLPAIPGEYTVYVDVGRGSDDANGTTTTLELRLDDQRLPGVVRIDIPPLARVTGTLLDAGFVLASAPDPFTGAAPVHNVRASATKDGAAAATAYASLKGFARSYTLTVPAGSSVVTSADVTAAIGRPRTEPDSFENDTLAMHVDDAPAVACDAGCTADVTAPALPDRVTLSGRLVDAKGKAVKGASVSARGDFDGATVSAYVLTDSQGRFTLRLPRAATYRLTVSAG